MSDVTIRLAIGGTSIEVAGPQEFASTKFEELANKYLEPTMPTAPKTKVAPIQVATRNLAPSELLRKAAPKNQSDRALLLAYYLERYGAQATFTTTQIRDLGVQTRNPFTNISETVARLVSQGLVMSMGDTDGQRAYSLTASGQEYVESLVNPKQ